MSAAVECSRDVQTTEKESEGAMAALGKRENLVNETPSLAASVPERYDTRDEAALPSKRAC